MRGVPALLLWAALATAAWADVRAVPVDPALLQTDLTAGWQKDAPAIYKQLVSGPSDKRSSAVHTKLAVVLPELIAHTTDPAARARYRMELGESLYSLRLKAAAAAAMRDLLNDCPGDADRAGEALRRILSWCSAAEPEEAPWVLYAAERALALIDLGLVPRDTPLERLAWSALLRYYRERGDFHLAAAAIGGLGQAGGDIAAAVAELYADAGALGEARKRLARGGPQNASRLSETPQPPQRSKVPLSQQASTRWEQLLARREFDSSTIEQLFRQSIIPDNAIPVGTAKYASSWTVLDAFLRSQPPEALAPLRQAHQQSVAQMVEPPAQPAALLAASRLTPFAPQLHRALAAYGERALRQGHVGLALRSFEDVRTHSDDPALVRQAAVGCWLAIAAGADDSEALKAALGYLRDDVDVQFMGASMRAGEVKRRLNVARAAAGPLESIEVTPLRGAAAAWPFISLAGDLASLAPSPVGQVTWRQGQAVLAGPCAVSVFDRTGRLAWYRHVDPQASKRDDDDPSRQTTVPGDFTPAVGDGMIITRWGANSGLPVEVRAFDLRTGVTLWTTAGDDAWIGLAPVNDPVLADGRVYVLGSHKNLNSLATVVLVCLDARNGKTLWTRGLASGTRMVTAAVRATDSQIDLTRFGNPVTVCGGWVYVSTNAGIVARCDARDGQLDWAISYDRVRLRSNALASVRRRGGAPVVWGDLAIFAPRDAAGMFAVNRNTGETVWHEQLLYADSVVGLCGGVLALTRNNTVYAINPRTGAIRWVYDAGTAGPVNSAATDGANLVAATVSGVVRLDPATGNALANKPWPGGWRLESLAIADGALLAADAGPLEATAIQEAAQVEPLTLPVRLQARLLRQAPRLLDAPDEPALANRAYLLTEGTLECLSVPSGQVLWRVVLSCKAQDIVWRGSTMILPSEDRVLAIDGATGKRLWNAGVNFQVADVMVAGPYVFATARSGAMAGIDAATGQLRWQRSFDEWRESREIRWPAHLMWDGKLAHLLLPNARSRMGAHLSVDPQTGLVQTVRPFPPALGEPAGSDAAKAWPEMIVSTGPTCLYFARGRLYEYLPHTGTSKLLGTFNLSRERGSKITVRGELVLLEQISRVRNQDQRRPTLLRRDTGAVLADTANPIVFCGPDAVELAPGQLNIIGADGGTARAIHLPAGSNPTKLFWSGRRGDMLWAITAPRAGDRGSTVAARADLLRVSDGAHLGMQTLDGMSLEQFQVTLRESALVTADYEGIGVFSHGAPMASAAAVWLVPRGQITPDGDLSDWTDPPQQMRTPQGVPSQIRLAHDDVNLYLALTFPAPPPEAPAALGGEPPYRVEMGIVTPVDPYHFELTPRPAAGVAVSPVGADGLIRPRDQRGRGPVFNTMADLQDEVRGTFRHDAARHEITCEISIPLSAIIMRWMKDWQRPRLSVCVWAQGAGELRELARWGDGLGGKYIIGSGLGRLSLLGRTRQAHQAAMELAAAMPLAPGAFERVWQHALESTFDAAGAVAALEPFIKLAGAQAQLSWFSAINRDLQLRYGDSRPLVDALVERALAQTPQTRQDYAQASRSVLSQWVFVPDSVRGIGVGLVDQAGASAKCTWGKDAYDNKWAGTRLGDVPPAGKWVELTVPLYAMGFADKPIAGVQFMHQGPVLWGPTAVVTTSARIAIDAPPSAEAWTWVSAPDAPGGKARQTAKESSQHTIGLAAPLTDHVPRASRREIIQQVWIDPAAPMPRSLQVSLHDGARWTTQLSAAPPPAGKWHELRLPVGGDGASSPIWGLAFAHDGGNVLWGKTILKAATGEHVLIDASTPPARNTRGAMLRSYLPRADGVWPSVDKRGPALAFDGASGCLTFPHRPELEPENFTLEASFYLDRLPMPIYWPDGPLGGDERFWIIGKNNGDYHPGNFSLVIGKQHSITAYHNAGGNGPPNLQDASSPPGAAATGRWQHAAATFDGKELRLYVDGEFVASAPATRARTPQTLPLVIGKRPDRPIYTKCLLRRARMYDKALSPDEVRLLAANPNQPPPVRPVVDVDAQAAVVADVAAEPAWQWTKVQDQPAHTDGASAGWRDHFVLLSSPVSAHLAAAPSALLESLRKQIPLAQDGDLAMEYFRRTLPLVGPELEARIEQYRWFLATLPSHPKTADLLEEVHDLLAFSGHSGARERTAQLAIECKLPELAMYELLRRLDPYTRNYVRNWCIAGPLAPLSKEGVFDDEMPQAPLTTAPLAGAEFAYGQAMLQWRTLGSATDYVSIEGNMEIKQGTGALAACTIRSDRRQHVVLEFSSRNASKLYVNGKCVLTAPNDSLPSRPHLVAVTLNEGPNIVVVKGRERWGHVINLWLAVYDLNRALPTGLTYDPAGPTSAPTSGPTTGASE